MRRRLRGVAWVVILLTLAAVCGSGSPRPAIEAGGPLSVGEFSAELCIPFHAGRDDITYGLDNLSNRGPSPIVIEGVEILGAHDLALVDSYYLRSDQGGISAESNFPPHLGAWGAVRRADGAMVPAASNTPGMVDHLFLHLRITATRDPDQPSSATSVSQHDDVASFGPVKVTYAVDGRHYVAEGSSSLQVKTKC